MKPVTRHINKVCNNNVIPIFIGWIIDENNILFIIIKIMDKICPIQRVV